MPLFPMPPDNGLLNQIQAITQRMPQAQESMSIPAQVPSANLNIDAQKVTENEGDRSDFYIPVHKTKKVFAPDGGQQSKILGQSGVTIARGFDLGQIKTEERLDQILNRIPDETMRSQLRTQFLPFLGTKLEDARLTLKQQNQLGNTKIDLRAMKPLNDAVLEQYKEDTANRYFADTGFNMNLLEPKEQQALFEIHYQTLDPDKSPATANAKAFKKIASAFAIGDTKGAIKAIKAHPQYKNYPARWNKYIKDLNESD